LERRSKPAGNVDDLTFAAPRSHAVMRARRAVERLLNGIGIQAQRTSAWSVWQLRLVDLLAQHQVRTVIDVGANDGSYAADLIRWGYRGRIVSFEPLPEAWRRLHDRARPHAGNWLVAPPVALSDRSGEAGFHEAGNSVSSSLLAMTPHHVAAAPDSAPLRTIKVKTETLDAALESVDGAPYFLKLDVQGAEGKVLAGAADTLDRAVLGVQLEMSLAPLYECQSDAGALDAFLRSRGFECWDLIPVFRHPGTLRLLQYDAIYFKTPRGARAC
jgi:FkbM family methyltransferase